MAEGTSSGYAGSFALATGILVTGAVATSHTFNRSITERTVQATVAGTGSVSATVVIEVTIDGVLWITAGTITLSGTTSATDGFAMAAPWLQVRANITAISGTGAAVTVTVAV